MPNTERSNFEPEHNPVVTGLVSIASPIGAFQDCTSCGELEVTDCGEYHLVTITGAQRGRLTHVREALRKVAEEADRRAIVLALVTDGGTVTPGTFLHPTFGAGFTQNPILLRYVGAPEGAIVRDSKVPREAQSLVLE